MKILTLIKLTLDISQLKYESTGEPLTEIAPKKMGDSDKCAVEEAVRLKEKLGAYTVVATIGSTSENERIIRDAYAMGIDEGYIVKVEDPEILQATSIGKIVSSLVEKTGPYDLIILGAGSLDTHSYTLGSIIASKLNIPIIAGVDSLQYVDGFFEALCIMEDGAYTFRAKAPLVVTVTTEANEPRIPTLKTILRSKKMEVKTLTIHDLGVDDVVKVDLLDVKRYVVNRRKILWDASEDLEKAVDKFIEVLVSEGVAQ
ncbi:MAG: hypothetical protein NZ929_07245 [Aigarchaeota archaeon]|nr:hypothetical protein [Aigarchaeota archaeon]MCX8193180.1 hypothetical protein [Nitrososphaeria archaeon]MDW7986321.1 hypothetical protein [Nitrososphaerota archaeon]